MAYTLNIFYHFLPIEAIATIPLSEVTLHFPKYACTTAPDSSDSDIFTYIVCVRSQSSLARRLLVYPSKRHWKPPRSPNLVDSTTYLPQSAEGKKPNLVTAGAETALSWITGLGLSTFVDYELLNNICGVNDVHVTKLFILFHMYQFFYRSICR